MPVVKASGQQTAVVGTEHTLLDTTDAGNYALVVDTANLVAGEFVELRLKRKVLSGGTKRNAYSATFGGGESDPVKVSFVVIAPHGAEFTLKQTAGTARIFDWSVEQP